jgi:hypothetical protein
LLLVISDWVTIKSLVNNWGIFPINRMVLLQVWP